MTRIGKPDVTNPNCMSNHYTVAGTDIAYNGESFRYNIRTLKNLREKVDELPEEIRGDILRNYQVAVKVILEASRIIHGPLVDQEKLEQVTSKPNDYHTDIEVLEDLAKIFKE
ncbi:hypothetical protein HOE04_01070 [archaeon]|nr:hypothetical protein [archaeon]